MNKKELIGKYKYLNHNFFRRVDTSEVLRDLKQLDEPEKIVIPQFVANWIEECKNDYFHLFGAMEAIAISRRKNLYEWFWDYDDNMELFARAWLDGYEVEEKRYLVTIKGIVSNFKVLKHNINEDTWYMSNKINYTDLKAYHTKKELEDAGFSWVFDCPGIEIEEVTE